MSGGYYNRALVEHLMPAIWDEQAAYGIRNPQAPDADMPKGFVNVKEGGTLLAHLADIRRGWSTAPMTAVERQSLAYRYRWDLTFEEIGKLRGVRKQSVQEAVEKGVGKLTAHLNGEAYIDGYDALEPVKAD